MNIPANILNELTCTRCETYLKRSPVYIKYDGKAVCGSCLDPKVQATRNHQYESLAQLMKFPCKYQEFGCIETLVFGNETSHESACEYKQFLCPVAESGKCEWLGRRNQFLDHCQDKHPDQVLKNPCTLSYDIKKSSSCTFLLNAFFQLLFLLHTKVSVTTGKIYHSVRFLGDPELASTYSYTLKVKRKQLEISKPGQVAAEGCLALQENTALTLKINSLLDFLDGFDNTTFFLTVRRACRNQSQGCTYVDTPVKCIKHEKYFCDYSSECIICKNFNKDLENSLSSHYRSKHRFFTYAGDSFWDLKGYAYDAIDENSGEFCFISSDAGTLLCDIWNNNKATFGFKIHAPIPHERLDDYICTLRITCRGSSIKHLYTLSVRHDSEEDWYISLEKRSFPLWNEKGKVNIEISRINS